MLTQDQENCVQDALEVLELMGSCETNIKQNLYKFRLRQLISADRVSNSDSSFTLTKDIHSLFVKKSFFHSIYCKGFQVLKVGALNKESGILLLSFSIDIVVLILTL